MLVNYKTSYKCIRMVKIQSLNTAELGKFLCAFSLEIHCLVKR